MCNFVHSHVFIHPVIVHFLSSFLLVVFSSLSSLKVICHVYVSQLNLMANSIRIDFVVNGDQCGALFFSRKVPVQMLAHTLSVDGRSSWS